ncbi:MAG TPA: hypothetical protein VG943_06345 [Caulobacterales bacterium]|nr:hypothetical protein [Caulobacterales bacterium]
MAEPLNATFFAFKRRDHGGVLIGATLTYFVLSLLLIAAFVAVNWNGFVQIAALFRETAGGGQPSDVRGIAAIFGLMGWSFLFLVIFYILLAAYEAACLRWMIHGETGGLFGLSLGAETWRVYAGYWIWLAISFTISFVIGLITLPLMFGFMMSSVAKQDPSSMIGPIYLVSALRALVQYAVMAFVGVRFAPGNATSILRRKFSYFDAWKVTKGRFWALFGSFLVLGLLWFVVGAVAFGATGGALIVRLFPLFVEAQAHPSAAASQHVFAALLAPENLGIIAAFYGTVIVTGVIFGVLFMGVNARAAIAAVEDGKIDGIVPGVAKTFE